MQLSTLETLKLVNLQEGSPRETSEAGTEKDSQGRGQRPGTWEKVGKQPSKAFSIVLVTPSALHSPGMSWMMMIKGMDSQWGLLTTEGS